MSESHTNTQRHPFMRLIGYALANRKLVTTAIILLVIATAADVTGPLLIKVFIDDYVVPGHWDMNPIMALAAAYVTFVSIASIANYLQAIKLNTVAVDSVQQIRTQVFDKVLKMPMAYFDQTPTGGLISRITNDTESIKELYVNVLGTFVQNGVRMLGIFVAMAILNWKMMLVCILILPFVTVVMVVYQRKSVPLFHRARALLSDINARLHESIQGMKVIQLTGQEQRFQQQFTDTAYEHYRARMRNIRLDSMILRPLIDLLHMLILAGLLFTFGYQSLSSVVEVGVIYAFINYLGRFTEPLIEITQRMSLYQQAIVAGERVFELLDKPLEATHYQRDYIIRQGDVRFDQVSFSYDGKREVLTDINVHIPSGGFYAIIGHTGSGKSTITNLLLRFYEPDRGQILIDGLPLNSFNEQELRQHVGIVQQDPFIFNSSVRDNITLGHAIAENEIIFAAQEAGLHEHVLRLPHGYDTVMNERGSNLSTGQRQLLALARTLVRRPKILILDEATANIDSHTEVQIQNALMRLRGNITLLVIAHRLSTIEKADQILVMHQGELAQQGSHMELLNEEGIYQHLYEMQALGVDSQ